MTLTAEKIYNQAVYYLQRYSSSAENLRRVLKQKAKRRAMRFNDVPPEANTWVDDVVEKCQKLKLVDDHAYTEGRVNALRRQGRSKHYIVRTLTQKGVDKKLIATFFVESEGDELVAARRFAEKKRLGFYGGKNLEREAQQKDLAKMLRAGFALNVAKKALRSDIEFDESFD